MLLFRTYNSYILLLTFVLESARSQSVCDKGFQCLPYSKCLLDDEFLVVYPCQEGNLSTICCPENTQTVVPSRLAAFPEKCGNIFDDDRITGGERALVGQFPWMALLGYKQDPIPIIQYICGGSVITDRFILTAAHCVNITSSLTLVSVRLGELDLSTEVDCDNYGTEKVCSAQPVDLPIEKALSHKDYNRATLKNDIALVKTKGKITFSEFIRPLCLPFGTFFQPKTYFEEMFYVSGWGKTLSSNIGGSNDLRYAKVNVWDTRRCKGDSGGPLFKTTLVNGAVRTYQLGIVSFASTLVCGNPELPTIYTRVDRYLDWIFDNIIH